MSMQTLVLGLLVFNLLIIVHELGHFAAARRAGMRVPEFSVGFGPRLFGFRRGETDYVWRMFPLGGFVLLPDLVPEDGVPAVSRSRRFWALMAGPLANVVVAILLVGPRNAVVFSGFWLDAIGSLFRAPSTAELSGLVGITQAVGQAASFGWYNLVRFSAFLSLNFALMNLLPIPGLDGGRLLGLLLEWVNGGRRPSWEPAVQAIGLLAILGLGLWVTGSEILRLFG